MKIISVQNKFNLSAEEIKRKDYVFKISKTKIDETFPYRQFYTEGFTPNRVDRNCRGDGILVYVREDVPSKVTEMNSLTESIFFELNLKKKKSLVNCSYNASNNNICDHLRSLRKSLPF